MVGQHGKGWRLRPRKKQAHGLWRSGAAGALAPGFRLVVEAGGDLVDAIARLRVAMWQARDPGFPDGVQALRDRWDGTASHFVILHGDEPVAAARLTVHRRMADAPDASLYEGLEEGAEGRAGVLSRLALAPRWAAMGFAEALDRARVEAAFRLGCTRAVVGINGSPSRLQALERLGFRAVSQRAAPVRDRRLEGFPVWGAGAFVMAADLATASTHAQQEWGHDHDLAVSH